ncbi:MAG: sugar phosphate isomerase/epimerase [Bacteroidales bacterium]|nr:sugar phosphate isomerase/epimerase [Bacteroidales bacterium]
MKPGISSYTYAWAVGVPGSTPPRPLSARDLIDIAELYRLSVVQIADNLPLENLPPGELDELFEYAGSKGISIEMGGRGLTAEHTMKCLHAAERLKSPILRMVIDSHGFEPGLQTIISLLKDLVPELKSRRIKLAVENHDRLKARDFEKIIQSVGSEWAGICLDSVNSMGAGEGFETVSEILLPYTINLHIKDFTIFRVSHKMGLVIEGRPAGQGFLNIPELAEKAESSGLCNSAVLELWTPPEPSLEDTIAKESAWAAESINYLKRVLQKIKK